MISVTPLYAFYDNFIWVITNDASKSVAVVDPSEAYPVNNFLEKHGLILSEILITHHHGDHTGGVRELVQQHNCKVYGPANENIPSISIKLSENDEIKLENGLGFKVLDTPGHTKGHICYIGNDALFCGDALFSSGCGRIFEGTFDQMYQSLEKIRSLPDETLVYCAHEYTLDNLKFAQVAEPDNEDIKERFDQGKLLRSHKADTVPTSIALEKKVNPFLRSHTPKLKENAEQQTGRSLESDSDVFATVRKWKDSLD
jgi:hydroxyacylglutathione hydrolase